MSARRFRLTFPDELVRQPIIADLVRRFDVVPNIRRADVNEDVGWIVCELDGSAESVEAALRWLEEVGVDVDRLEHPLEG